jgi:hypothetical protein
MRRYLVTVLFLAFCLLWLGPALMAAGPDRQNLEALSLDQKSLTFDSAPPAGDGPPSVIFIISPEFYYGKIGNLRTVLNNFDLSQEGGDSKGFGLTFMATKPFTPSFSLTFIYQWAYNEYEGGNLFPTGAGRGWTSQHALSTMAGLIADIDFGRYGHIQPSLLQGWDAYHGDEYFQVPGDPVEANSVNLADDRATSLMIWYTNDFAVSDSLVLTPYVGWRSIWVVMNNTREVDAHAWAHLASAGLSLKYNAGALSLIARAGVNHRVSRDDIPGLSTRAVAPGVTHMGWMTSWDRTIATYGLALDYNFGPGVLEIAYDGFAGSDTTYHKGAVVLIFPF